MKKLRNRILTYGTCGSLFLHSLFFSGCAYNWKGDTSWKLLGQDNAWKEEKITKGEPQKIDEKTEESKIEYKIGNIKLEDSILKIPVTETKIGNLSYCYKQINKIGYSQEGIYYRRSPDKINKLVKKHTWIYTGIGILGGFLLGSQTKGDPDKGSIVLSTFVLAGGLGGFLSGRSSGYVAAELDRTEKTCDFKIGKETKTEEKPETYWQKQADEKILSENEPAKNIPVNTSSEFFKFKDIFELNDKNKPLEEITAYTNSEGIANVKVILKGERNSFSKEGLIERINKEFSDYTKQDAKSFLDKIAESLAVKKAPIMIYTKAAGQGTGEFEVINGTAQVNAGFYTVDEESIRKAIKK